MGKLVFGFSKSSKNPSSFVSFLINDFEYFEFLYNNSGYIIFLSAS